MGPCPYGLPQGSVLGPFLYIIYTSEIGPLLTATSVLGHLYADDIQAYLHCPASHATSAVLAISKTLDVLETWMSTNRLRLNPSKTQFIWFGTRQQLAKLDLSAIAADFPQFIFSPVVRDLGVTQDQELTFVSHIHRLCRDSYYQLRQLRTVCYSRSYLRVYRYTYPCLHYSSTRLLQLTLCWPPSWAVTVPRQGPAHCRTPLWAHPQI